MNIEDLAHRKSTRRRFLETAGRMVIELILIGLLLRYVDGCNKERIEPRVAEKINYLNAKKELYNEAVGLLIRRMAFVDFTTKGVTDTSTIPRRRGCSYPTEWEVNNCCAKLTIYTDNIEISRSFRDQFKDDSNQKPVRELKKFLSLMREDLGYGPTLLNSNIDDFLYVRVRRDSLHSQ